jgi:hypothetical protein
MIIGAVTAVIFALELMARALGPLVRSCIPLAHAIRELRLVITDRSADMLSKPATQPQEKIAVDAGGDSPTDTHTITNPEWHTDAMATLAEAMATTATHGNRAR